MQLWDLLEWRQNASAMADTLIMMRGIVLKNSTWFTGLLAVNLALKPLSKKNSVASATKMSRPGTWCVRFPRQKFEVSSQLSGWRFHPENQTHSVSFQSDFCFSTCAFSVEYSRLFEMDGHAPKLTVKIGCGKNMSMECAGYCDIHCWQYEHSFVRLV